MKNIVMKTKDVFWLVIGIFFLIFLYIIVPFSNLKDELQKLRKKRKIVKKLTRKEYDDFKSDTYRESEIALIEERNKVKNELLEYVNAKIELIDHNAACFLISNYEKFRNLETSGNSWSENGWNFSVGIGNRIYVEEPCYLEFNEGDPVYYERKEIISYMLYKKELLTEAKFLGKENRLISLLTLLESVILALNSDIEYEITNTVEECYRRVC